MNGVLRTRGRVGALAAVLVSSCVYFNAMYDAQRQYSSALDLQRSGRDGTANALFDSVVLNTEGILEDHADTKYAADAALLKARSELELRRFDAAVESAAAVPRLTDDPRKVATARGLEGIALRELSTLADSIDAVAVVRLLSEGIDGDVSADDRARFQFHRGVMLLDLGRAEEAAQDLATVESDAELDSRIRQDLARGLYQAGQIEPSLQVVDRLLRDSRFANLNIGVRTLLDSLTERAPLAVDSLIRLQLGESGMAEAKRSLLILLRGRALERAADTAAALELYATLGPIGGLDAAHVRFRHGRLLIRAARTPRDIVEAKSLLDLALTAAGPTFVAELNRLHSRTEEFTHLVSAYEGRGATAAEAALRAAEIAGADLAVPRVSRGLYLRYLQLAPRSPWRAKAMAGALLHRGTPAGEWAGDRGAATDAELRRNLDALPAGDPYRVAIADLPRTAALDSAYVVAESDLRRRLVEIRMLYDTTAAIVTPTDSVPGDDAAPLEPDDDAEVF